MPKVTQIVNGEYIGGDKYEITDVGGGKSKVEFSPDNIIKAGTPVGAEILNEVQNNIIYEVLGTRVIEEQEEIYNCTLTGLDAFDFTNIKILMKVDSDNTKDSFLRIGDIKYKIKNKGNNLIAEDLNFNEFVFITLDRPSGLANIINNTYSGVDSNSNVRTASSQAVKKAYDYADVTYLKKSGDVSTGQQNMDTGPTTARSFLYSTFASQLGVFKGAFNNMDNGMYMDTQGTGATLYLKYSGNSKEIISCDMSDGKITYANGNITGTVGNMIPQIGECRFFDNPNINPATIWLGTTWGRIAENRTIRGATASDGVGVTGGSDTVAILQANLPNVNFVAQDHNHTRGSMEITGQIGPIDFHTGSSPPSGAFYNSNGGGYDANSSGSGTGSLGVSMQASRTWTGSTSGASSRDVPSGGSGTPLNVTNAFYKMHIWKRLT